MRRTGRFLMVAAVVATLGVAGTVFAYAGGWTLSDNPGSFTVKVAKMPRGVEPSVAKQGGQAVVTWSAQEIAPGVLMDHYAVTAHSTSDPPRPDVTLTVAAGGESTESVTFTAYELAGDRWRWTVVPRFRSWTGEASPMSRRLAFPAGPAAPNAGRAAQVGDEIAPSPAPATSPSRTRSPEPAKPDESPTPAVETSVPESAPLPTESADPVVEPPPAEQ